MWIWIGDFYTTLVDKWVDPVQVYGAWRCFICCVALVIVRGHQTYSQYNILFLEKAILGMQRQRSSERIWGWGGAAIERCAWSWTPSAKAQWVALERQWQWQRLDSFTAFPALLLTSVVEHLTRSGCCTTTCLQYLYGMWPSLCLCIDSQIARMSWRMHWPIFSLHTLCYPLSHPSYFWDRLYTFHGLSRLNNGKLY